MADTNKTPLKADDAAKPTSPDETLEAKAAARADDKGGATPPGTDPSSEKHITVRTTGEFMLVDPYSGDVVKHNEDCKVLKTTFIDNAIHEGRLEKA